MISLTGDVATGKEVARAAAATLKRVHLELGGKAPVLVFPDADLAEVAAAIKVAGFWNSGQECAAACRIMAADAIYDDLVARLVPAVESIQVGNPTCHARSKRDGWTTSENASATTSARDESCRAR